MSIPGPIEPTDEEEERLEDERLEREHREWKEQRRRDAEMRTAAREGRSDRVRELLAAGWPLNRPEGGGCDALFFAVQGGQHDLIRELLALGADLEVDSSRQGTALSEAVFRRYQPYGQPHDPVPLELLLAAGARFRLREAVLMDDLELAQARLAEGADHDFGLGEYCGPVLMEAARAGYGAMVDLLLESGAAVDGIDDLHHTPLMIAAQGGHAKIAMRLIARGAALDHNWPDDTALSMAIEHGHRRLYRNLLERGAKPGPIDAAAVGDLAWLERYLDSLEEDSFKYDNRLNGVRSITAVAVRHGQLVVVRAMIERGARLTSLYGSGSLLIEAARYGRLDVMRLLLDCGADIHEAEDHGTTALSEAIRWNQPEAAAMLRRAGATG